MASIDIILSIIIFCSLLLGAGVETAVCSFFRTSANVIVVRNWKAVESPWKPILFSAQDFPPNTSLNCVTDHPGFNPVRLQKWSLRMTACKFKTKGKQQYRQKGSEERLVVRVSIRGLI